MTTRQRIMTIFTCLALFLSMIASEVYAHSCGPSELELNLDDISSIVWQITAGPEEREEPTIYVLESLSNPSVITVLPATVFTAIDGMFFIATEGVGEASFTVKWFYEPKDTGGDCEVLVRVVQSASSAPTPTTTSTFVPTPTPTPTPTPEISSAPSGVIINNDAFVSSYNNVSTYGKKFNQLSGGVFIDTACECCECPPDTASMITSGSLTNDTPDPVTLHNGEFILQETDLAIPGRGFDWTFTRTYKSRITYDGTLGHNWDFNYNSRLIEITEDNQNSISTETFTPLFSGSFTKLGSVVVMDGHGRSDIYGLQSDGTYATPLGAYTRLTKNNKDGSFALRDRHGSKKFYDKDGFLVRLEDNHGNNMTFARDKEGRILEAIDTLGRMIEYRYNNDGRLIEVNDFINRSIKFDYDSKGDLVSVTSPSVTGTPNGNDFPDGKTAKYTYSSGFEDERSNHNLLTITAPNEAAAGGRPRLINLYETDTDSYAFDRVIVQTYGGTNASGIAAGGDVIYKYERLAVNPSGANEPVNRVVVTDRSGNVTEYEHNKLGNAVSIREFISGLRPDSPPFFKTSFEYNPDGERVRSVLPEGDVVENTYAVEAAELTDFTKSRFKQGNLLENGQIPDSNRGGDQTQLVPTLTYEPIYNQGRTSTDPRGNDPSFAPPNGGANSPARYTTTAFFDYQEGNDLDALADVMAIPSAEVEEMLNESGVKLGLGDLNGDGITNDVHGDVVKIAHPAVTLLNDSNQARLEGDTTQEIVELFTYNEFGQMTSKTDAEGNVTTYDYYPDDDPDGDGKDRINGKGSGRFGYLREMVVDAISAPERNSHTNPEPVRIKTQYFYDPVGNKVKVVDGRGIAMEYVVNELNQTVRIINAASVPEGKGGRKKDNLKAFKYITNIEYDFNDNVVKKEIENRDSNNKELAGEFVEYTYTYDILDNSIKETQEVSEKETLVTEYRYDANENRIMVIEPEGNFHETVYDERDLKVQDIIGAGGLSDGAPSINTFVYDKNQNLVETIDSEDNNGDGKNDSAVYIYDGFNRLVKTIDPVGNVTVQVYDPASNIVKTSQFGALGGASPGDNSGSGNVLLGQTMRLFDEMNRQFQQDTALFVSSGVKTVRAPLLKDGPSGTSNDGQVMTRYEYDRNSRMTFMIEDDGNTPAYQYDGVNRRIAQIDPEGNRVEYTYDNNNNVTRIVEIETTQAGNSPLLTEQFATINVYDALDRLVRKTDNIGQTARFTYDSRNNLILISDANGKRAIDKQGLFKGKINKDGNTMHYFYDGINRKIKEDRDLRKGGKGDGVIDTANPLNPDGKIAIIYEYDKDSRIIAITDDNGNKTRYGYDNLNRVILETFADGTTNQYEYDRDNNLVKMTDENGSEINLSYDALNRLAQKAVIRGVGVIGTTEQGFEYDGLSRLTKSFDNNDPDDNTDDAVVTYAYDSLDRLIEEVQNGEAVSSQWDGDENRLALIYPNGRKIETTYDKLDRIDTIKDSAAAQNIVNYDYIGPVRVLERTYGNGVRLTYLDDARTKDIGYDGIKRPVMHRHLAKDNAIVAGFKYGYDRMNNKLFETRLHESSGQKKNLGDAYQYDSVYRLTTFNRDVIDPEKASRSEEIQTELVFDGLGNWAGLTVGTETFKNTVNEMNEYDTFKNQNRTHDNNGNLVQDEQFAFSYDFANRLVKVTENSGSNIIARYSYDAHRSNRLKSGGGRRIMKVVTNSDELNENVRYFYAGIRAIQEQRTNGSIQQYVYGKMIDDPLTMDKDSNGDGTTDQTLFYHCDGKTHIIALTDSSGNIVERYTYDAYGKPSLFDSSLKPIASSQFSNPYLFTARYYDRETGLYYYRARYLRPEDGRFIQRDPLRDMYRLILYQYASDNPINYRDPLGEDDLQIDQTNSPLTKIRNALINALAKLRGAGPLCVGILRGVGCAASVISQLEQMVETLEVVAENAGTIGWMRAMGEEMQWQRIDEGNLEYEESFTYGLGEWCDWGLSFISDIDATNERIMQRNLVRTILRQRQYYNEHATEYSYDGYPDYDNASPEQVSEVLADAPDGTW